MGVETNHNLFHTILNFTISAPHVCFRIFVALALTKIQDQLVGSTADESLKIATKLLSSVEFTVLDFFLCIVSVILKFMVYLWNGK